MKAARFGRMNIGRCIKSGYGHMGCAQDVLPYLDSKCSGRARCSLAVTDIIKLGITPCPDELASYFEGSYICGEANVVRPSNCERAPGITQLPEDDTVYEVHSSSHITCPWTVRALPGQTINVTLYDFGFHNNHKHGGLLCHRLAVIRESTAGKETSVCSGRERVRNVYLSDGHVIHIQPINIKHRKQGNSHYYFMMKYSAIGCPNPSLPYPYHVSREDASLAIACNVTREVWHQACKDGKWIGFYGNCSDAEASPSTWGLLSRGWTSPFGIIVVVGLGIVLGVLFGVILLSLAVCVLKRRSRKGRIPGTGPFMEEVYQEPRPSETDELRMFDAHTYRRASYSDHIWKYPSSGVTPSMASSDRAPSSGYQTMTTSSYNTGTCLLSSGPSDQKGHSPKIRAKVQTIVHA